eukprot:3925696-Prymnesium_polylepis.1
MLVVVSGHLGQIGGDEGGDPDGGRQLRIDRAYAERNDVAGGDFILPEVDPRLVGVEAQVGLSKSVVLPTSRFVRGSRWRRACIFAGSQLRRKVPSSG